MSADAVVGANVRACLGRKGVTQRELARALRVSESSVGKKLKGVSSTFSHDEFIATARFLGVELTELLPGPDYQPTLTGKGRKR